MIYPYKNLSYRVYTLLIIVFYIFSRKLTSFEFSQRANIFLHFSLKYKSYIKIYPSLLAGVVTNTVSPYIIFAFSNNAL